MTGRSSQALFAFLLLGLFGFRVEAESYAPYPDHRIADSAGDYYVVVKREGGPRHRGYWGPVEMTIARRAPGSAPVAPARAKVAQPEGLGLVFDTYAAEDVVIRKGDTVLGRTKVTDPPSTVLVSRTGLGVVLLDQYGLNFPLLTRGDPALTVLSLKGETRFAKKLKDLFRPGVRFDSTLSGCPGWLLASWIDEERHELVIVGAKSAKDGANPLSVVRLDTGAVRQGNAQDVLRAIETRNPAGLTPALDFAIESQFKEAKPHLKAILQDAKLPLDARLRCAVFLSSLGDTSGKELLATSAVAVGKQLLQHPDWQDLENDRLWPIYLYAVTHLPDVLGDDCLPVLREAARLKGYPASVYDPFQRMGRKALPLLIELLEDQKDVEGQVMAADLLSKLKPPTDAAIAALIKALGSTATTQCGCRLCWVAAMSLGEIGLPAKSAIPTLTKLADDKDEKVRKAAVEAIERIKGRP